MKLRLLITMAALFVLAVPSPQAQVPAEKMSRSWKRIQSNGLEVVGNAPEKDLRRILNEIVAFRGTLKTLFPAIDLSSPEPTTLIVFQNYPSFANFVPRDGRGRRIANVGGYFNDRPDRNYLVLPMSIAGNRSLERMFHEYTHYVVSRNFHDVPKWLNEGLADFYSTFEVNDKGQGVIGKAPMSRIDTLRAGVIPPLSRLLNGESARRLYENPNQTLLFYAHSWLFVHYMTLSDQGKRQGQIEKFLRLLRSTKSAEAAAREAFGTTPEALDRALAKYSSQLELPAMLVSGRDDAGARESAAPVREVEVAELKARLMVEVGAEKDAENLLASALALDSTHADTGVTAGRLMLLQEKTDEAIRQLTASASDHPEHFPAQFYLGSALYEAERYQEAIAAFNKALALNRRSASTWFQLALSAMALGQFEQSDSAMAEAQKLYSTDTWHFSRAREALEKHVDAAAAKEAAIFVDRAGAADPAAPYAAFIGVIAERRLGRPAAADALLTRIIPALPPKSWTMSVARYMQGALTDEQFLDRAKDNGQETEAHTYIAFAALQAGRPELARPHLQWVKDKGDRNYIEYRLAKAELKRLEKPQAPIPSP